ncbi:MAG: BrxA family protein [Trueperaceae bacterium]|nr:BrxA family protein [Trueperaceae bacterium]
MSTSGPYSARITKGGLLFEAMRTLIMAYRPEWSRSEFRSYVVEKGVLAGASTARQKTLLSFFYSRYVETVVSFSALQTLLHHGSPKAQGYLLYLHAAQGDALIRDVVSRYLFERFYAGKTRVTPAETARWVHELLTEQGMSWNAAVATKAAHSILALLRDAGLLEGIQHKQIRYPYLTVDVAAYLVYHLRAEGFSTGKRVLEHPDWKLFLLTPSGVDEVLGRVADAGLITWVAAGSVYRLEPHHTSIEEAAHALV